MEILKQITYFTSMLIIFTACNKEKNQDLLRVGYQYIDQNALQIGETAPSKGAIITIYRSLADNEVIYYATAKDDIEISGNTVPGTEEATGSKDFLGGISGIYYVHAVVNDTVSNIGTTNYADFLEVNWTAGNKRKRDVYEVLLAMNITYENWWYDSKWILDSITTNGTNTTSSCDEDNTLHIYNNPLLDQGENSYTVVLDYNEGNDVCIGVQQNNSGFIVPYTSVDKLRKLDTDLTISDNANNVSVNFHNLIFSTENLIVLEGVNQISNDSVKYFMSRI